MLQFLRDKSSGWVATVVLGLLVVPFAIFGIDQYSTTGADATVVARIDTPPSYWKGAPNVWPVTMLYDHHEITVDEYRSRLEQLRQEQRTQLGANFDAIEFDKVENKRALVERMIDEKIGAIAASAQGLVVSDADVQREIAAVPGFQVAGKFDPNTYLMALRQAIPSQTPKGFEALVRTNLQARVLPQGIANTAFVTPSELDYLLKLSNETRDVTLVAVPAQPDATLAVSDADVTKWYSANKAKLQVPETVALEYVIIDSETLPAPAPVTDAVIKAEFDKNAAKYAGTQSREAAHILVEVPANASKSAQDAAKKRIDALYAEVTAAGADFAAIAKAKSDDTGSKTQGGNLGTITKGAMPKAFEDAAFAMQANTISKPVKSEFGWHIIRVGKVTMSNQKTFEQAKPEIAAEMNKAAKARQINDVTGKILDAVYRNPTDLTGPAKANGLTVQTAGPLERSSNDGLFANAGVKREVFKDSMLKEGTVSEPVDISPTQKVLLRVAKHNPARTRPLAEVREAVIQQLRVERAQTAALAKANEALAKMKSGATLEAATAGMPKQDVNAVPRQAGEMDPKIAAAIFSIPSAATGAAATKVFTMTNGQPMMVHLRKATPGKTDIYTPAQRQQISQQFSLARGIEELNTFIRGQRKGMKIRVIETNL